MFRLALITSCFLLAGTVAAQGAEPADVATADVAAARDLFHQGIEAVEVENWAEAADLFGRSFRLRESRIVRYNLGVALHRAGRLMEAREHLSAVVGATEDPEDPLRLAAQELLANITPSLGRLRVDVDGDTSRIHVTIDAREMPPELIGVEQPASPGERVIRLLHAELELDVRRTLIRSGQLTEVAFVAPALPEESSPRRTGLWVALAVAGAVLIAGAIGIAVGVRRSSQPNLIGDVPLVMTLRAP